MSGCYLLHFHRPHQHARHYLGYSHDISARLEAHKEGQGARLVEVVVGSGNGFQLVRTWEGATRTDERRLKNSKNSPRLCPVCSPNRRTR